MQTHSPQAQALLQQIKNEYLAILGDTMVGFYVHGSLAFGCFSWERSDLDFLVVVSEEPTAGQKHALIRILLDLEEAAPQKGFEMSVVTEDAVNPFVYPTPYVLHYSGAWREAYRTDLDGTCRRLRGYDPDLAAHITVTRAVGFALYGKPIGEVFAPVPTEQYLDSIRLDIENAREDIHENPVYVILNLCRVLGYIKEGLVLSKEGGGMWGIANLPAEFVPLITNALAYYREGIPFACEQETGHRFAAAMLSEINRTNKPL